MHIIDLSYVVNGVSSSFRTIIICHLGSTASAPTARPDDLSVILGIFYPIPHFSFLISKGYAGLSLFIVFSFSIVRFLPLDISFFSI